MALVLNDEQRMVKESADGFFAEHAPVSQLRRLRDSADADGFDRGLWARMAEMGFTGVAIPEQFGGTGLGLVAAGLIQEAIGRNLSLTPFLSSAILSATAIVKGGSEDQKAGLLPKMARGELILALAADEKARHQPASVTTKAQASGNGFRLTGVKPFVLDGHVADRLIVAARTSGADDDKAGISLFLVDPKAAGVNVKRRSMVDSRNAAHVTLDGVQVDGADMLGEIGGGFAILAAALDAGRACLAAEMLGVSARSFDTTVDYLKQREQLGVKIGTFQALQHRAAPELWFDIVTRSVTLKALTALDEGDERAALFVALAKAKAGDVVTLATNEAVQMHGGIGMTDEFDIGFYMKRARAAAGTFGDDAFHGDRVARLLNY
jgi:acyl-CoA dehydrogenase